MATTIITDTLRFTKDLEAAGMPTEQAEALAATLNKHATETVTEDHLDARMSRLELRLKVWMLTTQAASTGVILAVVAKAHGWF